ncbi:hypothetical protein PHACT_02580 [Pseudohongiella acticola]|uniref:DUF5666 domain-containing protein n=1 Tax=Pseudohongiella acticola TaxID=1524254 RepID=A0A1E8CIC6_9GAMM|nr:hypothetical protein [Pseudohongiella acticola]OFE12154.1 hypothetical protein PHACT_02580 [Pseudohongiella acticola]
MCISIPKKIMIAATAAITTFVFALPLAAQPQTGSYLEYRARMQSDADEYFFFEDDRKQVVSYSRDRIVRVCAADSAEVIPLRVEYDDRTTMLTPGDCIRVEAMDVFLEPADSLEPNTFMRVEVDTLN